MSNTIQIGGIGKSPVIDKINRLNVMTGRIDMAAKLEQAVFQSNQEETRQQAQRRNRIIREYSISFHSNK